MDFVTFETAIAFLKDFADKGYENAVACITWLENQGEPNPYSGVSFKYNGHIWGMCARDNGVEILVDGEIKERIFLDNKPQGKSALEAIREEKVDNTNKIEPKDYSSIDPHFGKPIEEIEPKFKVGDIVQYITDSTDRRKIEEIDTLCNMYHTDSFPIMFEIEDEWKVVLNSENVEQNLSEEVEPKFHKGDWIAYNHNQNLLPKKIIQITNKHYVFADCSFEIKTLERDWHIWNIQDAKEGDVLAIDNDTIVIFKDLYNSTTFHSYCHIEDSRFDFNKDELPDWWNGEGFKPATKEQSDILFQKMREAGYKWNTETKTLEMLVEPKFKVGDRIIPKNSINKSRIINAILDNEYNLFGGGKVLFSDQNNWELSPDKFDITTLVPFESRVLIRDNVKDKWYPGIWGYYDNAKDSTYPYKIIGVIARYCIPYEGNEHLLGKTDDCDEYYKTWGNYDTRK